MPQTEDIEYIKDYEAYDCINASEDDDDFDPQDEPYEPSPEELQNMSQNPFTAKVFDPETMLFDLAEARKTETKFRENILSMMMSVLISSDKPNALLCGPAGCTTKSRSIGFNSDSTSETQFISDLSDYFDVELINRFSQKYTFSEDRKSVV